MFDVRSMVSDGHRAFREQVEWKDLGQYFEHRVRIEILPNIPEILKHCKQ